MDIRSWIGLGASLASTGADSLSKDDPDWETSKEQGIGGFLLVAGSLMVAHAWFGWFTWLDHFFFRGSEGHDYRMHDPRLIFAALLMGLSLLGTAPFTDKRYPDVRAKWQVPRFKLASLGVWLSLGLGVWVFVPSPWVTLGILVMGLSMIVMSFVDHQRYPGFRAKWQVPRFKLAFLGSLLSGGFLLWIMIPSPRGRLMFFLKAIGFFP